MLVSVIIPIYKVEEYMDQCIESVINQTYKDLEIILVDDGSPDLCPKKCEEWEKKDGRIIVIHKNNGGLSSARNSGLEIMSGKYVFFLDSDDFINENTIQLLINQMNHKSVDIVSCSYTPFENEINKTFVEKVKFITSDNKDFYMQIISNHAWGKLYRAELFENVRYPEGRNYEDIATTHKLYFQARKIAYTFEKLYFYRIHSGTITTLLNEKNLLDIKYAYESVKSFYSSESKFIFYQLTILFSFYSRLLRAPKDVRRKLKLERYIQTEFNEKYGKINIFEFKKSPLFRKVVLYRLHLAKAIIIIWKNIKG